MSRRIQRGAFGVVAVIAVAAALLSLRSPTQPPPEAAGEGLSAVPADRTPGVSEKLQPGLDLASEDLLPLTVCPRAATDFAALERHVREIGGTVVGRAGERDGVPRLRVKLAGAALARLAEAEEVSWIERHVRRRFLNDAAVGAALMNVETARNAYGLTGRGQVITTSDSGVDTGDFATLHPDLCPNLIGFALSESSWLAEDETEIYPKDVNGHGTHTAGSLVGTGACSGGRFKGAAPEAKLWAWFCGGKNGYVYAPDSLDDLFRPAALGPTNAYVHSASWGGDTNVYSSESQAIDAWCWAHPDFLPVFAAGNDGKDSTISAEAAAKNVLCVGATENYHPEKSVRANDPDELAYFSSRGPMPDGRIKPDICAPGTYVISTRSHASVKTGWGVYDENYLYNSGTSMATPLAAGTVALIRQWLVEEGGFTNRAPSAALMKAIITGGATRLGTSIPNKDFGWGRVNLTDSLFPTNGTSVLLKDYIPFGSRVTQSFELCLTRAAPLDVQLCWIDPAESPWTAQRKSLVLDLDLVVSNQTTGVVWTPNDHLNNLESVHLDVAEPAVYTVFVRSPTRTSCSSSQGGAAALYVRGAMGEPEFVTVRIAGEGGGDRNCSPAVGEHRYLKGETVTFTAGKYADEDGEDYRYSAAWGLEVECYPFICWKGTGLAERGGFEPTVTLTLTNDVDLTWWWRDRPSEVALWLESYDDYYNWPMYPGAEYGVGYWITTGNAQTVTAEDSPMGLAYASADAGLTVPVNGPMYVSYQDRVRQVSYGMLKFTSFFVRGEDGMGQYGWNFADHGRLADAVTLPMESFTVVDFGYADASLVWDTVGLPYWWWMRQFAGAYDAGLLTQEESAAAGDPDGDGFANAAEYAEPTDPWDAQSFPFRFTEISPTGITFIASTAGGVRLQHVDRLGDTWTNVWSDTAGRTSVTNRLDLTRPRGFYRMSFERD